MTTGRHAGSPKGTVNWVVIAGAVSVITGVCILPAALDKLVSNPPNTSPGPGLGFTILAVSACLILVPVTASVGLLAVRRIRQYRAWMRTLTPQERLAVHFAEGAAMEAGHIALRDHNRREDARLTDSVIGIDRSAGDEQAH
jgi:hypothetical protein